MRRRLTVTFPLALLGLLVFAGTAAADGGILGLPGTEPLSKPLAPVTQAVTPVTDAVKPVADAAKPVTDAAKPVTDAARPVTDAVKPVTEAAAPVTQAAAPVTQAAAPVVQAAAPVVKATEPVVRAVPTVAETAAQTVAPVVQTVATTAAPVVQAAAQTAAPVVRAAATTVAPIVRTAAQTAAPVVQTVATTAAPIVTTAAETVAPVVGQVAGTVAPVVERVAETVAPVVDAVTTTTAAATPVATAVSRTFPQGNGRVTGAGATAIPIVGVTHTDSSLQLAGAETAAVSSDAPTQASGAPTQARPGGGRSAGTPLAGVRALTPPALRPDPIASTVPTIPAGCASGCALDRGGRSGGPPRRRARHLGGTVRAAPARPRPAGRIARGRRGPRLDLVRLERRTLAFLHDSGHDAEVPARCARGPLAPACACGARVAGTRRLPARAPRLAPARFRSIRAPARVSTSSKGDEMKRYVIAAISCLALIVGVSPAAAGDGLGGILPTVTQTTQQNTNRSGDATASNANGTWQGNDQSQTGYGGDATSGDATAGGSGCCGSGGDATSGDAYGGDVTQSQEAANTNTTTQEATATSKATQVLPVNVNVPVCLALSCESGDVEQSNRNSSGDATAWNANHTGQSNEQSQKGVGGDATSGDATAGSGDATTGKAVGGDLDQSQTASNSNETTQSATATSKATQLAPVNVNVPVCIAKHCETGDVEQSNTNRSGDATASNENGTWQGNDQRQQGFGGDATSGDATTGGNGCCRSGGDATSGDAYGGDVTQSQQASNANSTTQTASATSKATQVLPVNVNVPVCVAWHCKTGDVEQSNRNSSGDAAAWNANHTGQSNEQSQKGVGGDARSGDATAEGGCCDHGKGKARAVQGAAPEAVRRQAGRREALQGRPEGRAARPVGRVRQGEGRRRRPAPAGAERQPHGAGRRGDLEGEAVRRAEPGAPRRPGEARRPRLPELLREEEEKTGTP